MIGRRGTRRERGAVAVEFALVAPLLFGLLFGFLEVGMLVLADTAGTNAAREGARLGSVGYLDADDVSSAAHAAIAARVDEKLVNLVDGGSSVTVTVRCLDYDSPNPQIPCDDDVEVGRDLIEVAVSWRPKFATGFVSPSSRTDRARMTISGDPSTAGPPSGGGGTLAVLTLDCDPATVAETDSTQADVVECEVHRTTADHTVTVAYATADGTAVAGSDYTAASGLVVLPAGGALTTTFSVSVLGDTTAESTESFSVALTGPSNATLGTPSTATITITDADAADTTPPGVASIVLLDNASPLGKVDTIVVTFSEPLGSCPGTTGWDVVPGSPGYTLSSVSKGSSSITLALNEGAAYTTGSSGFAVSYTYGPSGVCDAVGNPVAGFGPIEPTDQAVPYLLGIAGTPGGNSVPGAGDAVTLQFSEPMQMSGAGSLVLDRANGNNQPTTLTIAPYVPAVSLGTVANWFGGNSGGTATFATTLGASGNDFVVTLGACAGDCSLVPGASSVSIPAFGWAPSFPKDAANNPAATPVASPATAIPFLVSLF